MPVPVSCKEGLDIQEETLGQLAPKLSEVVASKSAQVKSMTS